MKQESKPSQKNVGFKKQNPLQESNEEKYQNDSWATEISILMGFLEGETKLM